MDKIFYGMQARERELKTIAGTINIEADASVSSVVGRGFTAARTAAGTYTITLDSTLNRAVSIQATMFAATAVDLVPQIVSETLATTKLVVIKTLAAGVATDPAAVCKLQFVILANNTGLYNA